MRKITVGVMGGAGKLNEENLVYQNLARELANSIINSNCILLTGETSGVPRLVQENVIKLGGSTIGISPSVSYQEHTEQMTHPPISDHVIYTGMGLIGRNIINIRSSDILIFMSGSIGTLNEFTVAYSDGKVIGIIEGSGGICDYIAPLIPELEKKDTGAKVFFNKSPKNLLDECLLNFVR